MQTIRQIEKLWTARQYNRLAMDILRPRVEYSHRLAAELGSAVPAAALILIRLDELNQAHHPLCGVLVRTIIAAQDGDGGWGDPVTTALAVRALFCARGHGVTIDRGIGYLANLQKEDGSWPALPIRRAESDVFATAFILFQLADHDAFRAGVRFDRAAEWFARHQPGPGDEDTSRLWHRARSRARLRPVLLAQN